MALICTMFLRLSAWHSYRYHTLCGSSPTCRRVGLACLRMCSFPPPGCEVGFRGQFQLYHVHNNRLYLPGFFFCTWYDLEKGKIYLPPGLEGANLVVYQPIGARGQLYAQVGRCASLFAPEFSLVHVIFQKGCCLWNQLGFFSLDFPFFISDQVVKRFRFILMSTLNRLQSAGINLRYGKLSARRFPSR